MSVNAKLLEAVRKEAKPGIWSNGVNLARAGAVALQATTPGEVELRVGAPGRTVALTVVLYPADEAWECDCPSRVDPCEHVVAAAITLEQADKADAPVAVVAQRWSRVAYRFTRVENGLRIQRALAHPDGTEEPLDGSLASIVARPAQSAKLQVEQWDLIADRLLEKPTRVALPPEKLEALLKVLEKSRNVLLDGRPVAISEERIFPRAIVEDREGNFLITIKRDPRVTEVLSAGVALAADSIARLGETAVSGNWL